MIKRLAAVVLVAAGCTAAAACSTGQPPASTAAGTSAASSHSPIDNAIDHAMQRAEVKLTTQDITVSNDDSGAPEAKITPRGDLVIAGKPVELTPAQRADVLAYRQQLIAVGRQGIAVGRQGATLGLSAAGAAIAAVFSGESEQQVRQRVEAKASGIRQAAAKICDRLPALLTSQQQLAAAVPEFRPYARLTPAKIDRCRADALKDDHD